MKAEGTAIYNPEAPVSIRKQLDGKWYNQAGQLVDKSYKGLVIVNGKKFVNK